MMILHLEVASETLAVLVFLSLGLVFTDFATASNGAEQRSFVLGSPFCFCELNLFGSE